MQFVAVRCYRFHHCCKEATKHKEIFVSNSGDIRSSMKRLLIIGSWDNIYANIKHAGNSWEFDTHPKLPILCRHPCTFYKQTESVSSLEKILNVWMINFHFPVTDLMSREEGDRGGGTVYIYIYSILPWGSTVFVCVCVCVCMCVYSAHDSYHFIKFYKFYIHVYICFMCVMCIYSCRQNTLCRHEKITLWRKNLKLLFFFVSMLRQKWNSICASGDFCCTSNRLFSSIFVYCSWSFRYFVRSIQHKTNSVNFIFVLLEFVCFPVSLS